MYERDMCGCFFFKQKTAYEMRISDWSSDVCSSDLTGSDIVVDQHADCTGILRVQHLGNEGAGTALDQCDLASQRIGVGRRNAAQIATGKIGRASCRERV